MRAFLVLFADAWRESRDRRAVQVLLLFGLLIALFCLGMRFETPSPAAALAAEAKALGMFQRGLMFIGSTHQDDRPVEHEVSEVRPPRPEDDLPSGLDDPHVVEIRVDSLDQLDELVRAWSRFRSQGPRHRVDLLPLPSQSIGPRERAEFFRQRFESAGLTDVIARPIEGDERAWMVAATATRRAELRSRWKLGLLFGALTEEVDAISPAEMVLVIELGLATGFVGLVGTLIVLATFASSVPEMARKGAIELVLARPIGRARLILLRYVAAVLSVFLLTSAIFAACGVALWLKSGFADPRFVLCGVTTTAIFAMLYPVALLLGVATRNSTLATLGSIGFWGAASALVQVREQIAQFDGDHPAWKKVLDAANWCLPKTGDVDKLNVLFLARANLSPEAAARILHEPTLAVDWWYSGGTSAAFAATMLAATLLVFRRRDW